MLCLYLTCIRKRDEWDVYEPIVDLLSNEGVDALEGLKQRKRESLDD